MSFKTNELIDLFPDAYAASDPESLLYKVLDAIAAELMTADEAVKWLLKSHWVNYAEGKALDGLAALYGVTRRQLRDGTLEPDSAFRLRLKSVVDLFVGGGTVEAIKGAVRSALGLPYNLDRLNLSDTFKDLRDDLDNLVRVVEFSPTVDSIIGNVTQEVDRATQLMLEVNAESVQETKPQILWKFTQGSGRNLSLTRLDSNQGVRSQESLIIPSNSTLVLSIETDNSFSAVLNGQEIADQFTNLDGSRPARLPTIPRARSQWQFRAQSGLYDLTQFDLEESFDLPQFTVEFLWIRYQPLTFEVYVPYFFEEVVQALEKRYNYPRRLLEFQGLPRELIQTVVNQTKAAGVQGSVQFSLNWFETHDQADGLRMVGQHRTSENLNARDSFDIGSFNRIVEPHAMGETFIIGAVFDVSTFDTNYGFQ
ncbi:MAG: hypothetical protein VKJ24_21805 [Synechococcales bacterium]|nr:hypothetical protein [Synechococcales bacterium]